MIRKGKCFMNTNYNSNLSYRGLNLLCGASDTLKKVIKPKNAEDFKAIMNSLDNSSAHTSIFGRGNNSKKLDARISSMNMDIKSKECSQGLFESTMHFLKRVCKKSVKIEEETRNASKLNIDEFLKKFE